jgi:hypothetical protein
LGAGERWRGEVGDVIPLPLFVPVEPNQKCTIPADAAWTVRLSPKYDAPVETWDDDDHDFRWSIVIRKDDLFVDCDYAQSVDEVHEILRGWLP